MVREIPDGDFDSRGDVCDHCMIDANFGQMDFDGGGVGDVDDHFILA